MFRPLVDRDVAAIKFLYDCICLLFFLFFRDVVEVYKAYDIVKDDVEAINELGIWPSSKKDISFCVSTKAKSALTRALNKERRLLPFTQAALVKGRKRGGFI